MAYAWVIENLAPPGRRDIFVYGSHLGATLATSLALTEARPHEPFGVRGLIAYNGIYNWTMFLPDHRIHKRSLKKSSPSVPPEDNPYIEKLGSDLPMLFRTPSNLFDCFASPSLFFHGPGLLPPKSFYQSIEETHQIEQLAKKFQSPESDAEFSSTGAPPKNPRRSHLVFPPRQSTLKIPPSLFLHDPPPLSSIKKKSVSGHTLYEQAQELAGFMRRSVEKVELKARKQWDEDITNSEIDDELHARIKTLEVCEKANDWDLGVAEQHEIRKWLQRHFGISETEYNA